MISLFVTSYPAVMKLMIHAVQLKYFETDKLCTYNNTVKVKSKRQTLKPFKSSKMKKTI